jgi:hypothetical protein
LNDQYLEILTARENLFKFDVCGQRECKADPYLWRCIDKVNWNVDDVLVVLPKEHDPIEW